MTLQPLPRQCLYWGPGTGVDYLGSFLASLLVALVALVVHRLPPMALSPRCRDHRAVQEPFQPTSRVIDITDR